MQSLFFVLSWQFASWVLTSNFGITGNSKIFLLLADANSLRRFQTRQFLTSAFNFY